MGSTPEDNTTQEEEENSVHQKRTKRRSCGRTSGKWFTEVLVRQKLSWFTLQKFWDRVKLVSPWSFERRRKTSDRRAPHAPSAKKYFEE